MDPVPSPTDLPVEDAIAPLRAALADAGSAVLEAPPGAGKTTLVPLRLLGEPWLDGGRIVVLEPRRVAARAAARRMAELAGGRVGDVVGYRTRDERQVGPTTRIEVVTEGILVRRLQDDPWMEGVGLVVLDEVHERNLVSDLALALLVDVRREARPDLRVLAMSATVEADRTARALGGEAGPAPVISSPGRAHPVAVRHEPPDAGARLDAHVARVVARTLAAEPEGDVLVFLPGAADIGRVHDRLGAPGALGPGVDVHRLFGALSPEDQDRALAASPAGRRRVVLSTDLAESSLTVAGVRIVVDAGLVRVPRHDPATGLTRLRTEPASVASADQRAGRAGRLGPGLAVRLWAPSEAARRPRWPVPEIEVTDLATPALEVAVWGTPVADLALPDQPPAAAWAQAHAVLGALGALDAEGRPTDRGRAMATHGLHPRLAALALAARDRGAGWTGAVLAAVLEEGDVLRGHPAELSADLAERVRLVADPDARHPAADRRALRSARRRARQVAGRLGERHREVDLDAVGALVAVAHPERLAQAQGGGGYRLRGGGGAALVGTDPLAPSTWLAVARIDDGPRGPEIRLAAHLERAEVEALVGTEATTSEEVVWDDVRRDVRRRRRRTAGALLLDADDGPAEPGPATTEVLLERVRQGELLRWD
ncbi:MAG: ATP-dependent helicase HrpB, partial [Acidimicrobiales bacterium]|nr:ATP-dependent helicase HrpB [Acidimicrobiales bacterium]